MESQTLIKSTLNTTWKILIIDENEEDYRVTRAMLSQAQGGRYEICWAASYEAGLQALAAGHYHAVLVDYDLGPRTGIELIREASARRYPAPLILFNDHENHGVDVDNEAMQAGAALYLVKNEVNPLLLERLIRYAIERSQTEAALYRAEVDQHRADEALRQSEEKFAKAFQYNPAAMTITRAADSHYTDVNESFCQMVGYTREEIIGHSSVELGFFSKETRETIIGQLNAAGYLHQQETPVKTKDGSMRQVLFSLDPIEFGGEASILATMIDITERKQAEWELRTSEVQMRVTSQALRERDRRLSVALDAAQLGTWTYRFDNHMFELDERARQMYRADGPRVDHEALVQKYLHPDDLPVMQAALQKAANPNGDGHYQMVYRIFQPDGSLRWLNAWGQAEFEGQGAGKQAVRLTGVTRDITWEKEAALALAESNAAVTAIAERFQAVLENAMDAAYRRDLRTDRYDYVSPVIEQIFGFTVEEMHSMAIEDTLARIHPDDLPAVEAKMAQADAQGEARLIYRFRCKNGSYRWVADFVTVTKDAEGRPTYRTGVVRNVTEQIQAQQALKDSEERFRLASRAVSGVLYDLTLGREEVFQSEGLERVVGYHPGDEPGGSKDWWPRNIHPEDYPRIQAELQAAIDEHRDSFAYEYRIRHKDGHWVYIWDQGLIVRDENEEARRIVGMCADISDRVKAEEAVRTQTQALRESEERFRDLANNISQLAWMADETGQIFWYNQRWFDYTGTTLEEMERLGGPALLPPEHNQQVMEKIRRCFGSGEYWEDTFPLRGKEGQYRWFLSRAVPIKDEAGKIIRWFGTNTDVTEQRALQQQIENERARLESVLESLPVGVWVTDATGRIIGKNPQADRIWAGDSPLSETIEAYQVYPMWYPDSGAAVPTEDYPLARTLRTGQPVESTEYTVRRFDGAEATFLVSASPVKDAEGRLTGAVAMAVDITERKQAEALLKQRNSELQASSQALQESEKRLRRLVDGNIIGIDIRDAAGNIQDANEAFLHMIGYTLDELASGKLKIKDLTPPAYQAIDEQAIQEALATGSCQPYEKEYIRKDGQILPAMVAYTRLDGNDERFIGYVLDLSALKQAQASLQDYADRLKRSNQELEQFAFVASHDLQEPLRKIIMFGESLSRHAVALDETGRDYLGRMQNAAERMQAMINGLLDLSRVNTRGGDFTQVDLNRVVGEVISDLEPRIHAVEGQIESSQLPVIEADEQQMRRLFQNLIGNALKFHKPGTPPVVRVSGVKAQNRKPPTVEIRVTDNGIGFDPQYAERIFQPFQRLNGRNDYEGTGLGLAICQKIVERHHGTVSVESTPGEGTTFIIHLPIK